jgi:hypothetical protein
MRGFFATLRMTSRGGDSGRGDSGRGDSGKRRGADSGKHKGGALGCGGGVGEADADAVDAAVGAGEDFEA